MGFLHITIIQGSMTDKEAEEQKEIAKKIYRITDADVTIVKNMKEAAHRVVDTLRNWK